MKCKLRVKIMAVLIGMLGIPLSLTHAEVTTYTTDWLANSGPGSSGDVGTNYVQEDGGASWTASDGTVYVDSTWDENGRSLGIYKNGQILGRLGGRQLTASLEQGICDENARHYPTVAVAGIRRHRSRLVASPR